MSALEINHRQGESVLKMMGVVIFNVSLLSHFLKNMDRHAALTQNADGIIWEISQYLYKDVVAESLIEQHSWNITIFTAETTVGQDNTVNGTGVFAVEAITLMFTSGVIKNSRTAN